MGLFQGWAVLASGWLCREEVFWDRARGGDEGQRSLGQCGDLGNRHWAGADGVAAGPGTWVPTGPLSEDCSGRSCGHCWAEGWAVLVAAGVGASMRPRADGALPAQFGVGSGGAVPAMDAHLTRSPTAPAWGWSHRLLPRHGGDVALTWHPGHTAPAVRTPGAPGQRQVPASAIDQSPLSRYRGTTGWGEGPAAPWGHWLGSGVVAPGWVAAARPQEQSCSPRPTVPICGALGPGSPQLLPSPLQEPC